MNRTLRTPNTAKAPNKKSQIPAEGPKTPKQQPNNKSRDTDRPQNVHEKSPQADFHTKQHRQSMNQLMNWKRGERKTRKDEKETAEKQWHRQCTRQRHVLTNHKRRHKNNPLALTSMLISRLLCGLVQIMNARNQTKGNYDFQTWKIHVFPSRTETTSMRGISCSRHW